MDHPIKVEDTISGFTMKVNSFSTYRDMQNFGQSDADRDSGCGKDGFREHESDSSLKFSPKSHDDPGSEEQPPDSQSSPTLGGGNSLNGMSFSSAGSVNKSNSLSFGSNKKRKHPSATDGVSSSNALDLFNIEAGESADNLTAGDTKKVSVCAICYDKSSGVHYGVPACEGCKGFFRRIVTSTSPMTNMRCNSGQNNCIMSPSTRNTCQRCRLQKCFNVGMTRKRSKLGRRSKQCKVEPEISQPRFSENRILSDDEMYEILASESVNFHPRGPSSGSAGGNQGPSSSPVSSGGTSHTSPDPLKSFHMANGTAQQSGLFNMNNKAEMLIAAAMGHHRSSSGQMRSSQGQTSGSQNVPLSGIMTSPVGQFGSGADDISQDSMRDYGLNECGSGTGLFDMNQPFSPFVDCTIGGAATPQSSIDDIFSSFQQQQLVAQHHIQTAAATSNGGSMAGNGSAMSGHQLGLDTSLLTATSNSSGSSAPDQLSGPDICWSGSPGGMLYPCSGTSSQAASPGLWTGSGRDSASSLVSQKMILALRERYKREQEQGDTSPHHDFGVGGLDKPYSASSDGSEKSNSPSDKLSSYLGCVNLNSGGPPSHSGSSTSKSSFQTPPVAPIQVKVTRSASDAEIDDMLQSIDNFFQQCDRQSDIFKEFDKMRVDVPAAHQNTCIVIMSKMEEFFRSKAFSAPVVTDRDKAWEIMLRNMAPVLMRVISFCRVLPGLKDVMEPHDAINVIKLSMFDIISLRFTRLINLQQKIFYDPELTVKIPQNVMCHIPIGPIFDEYMHLAAFIHSDLNNQVDDPEMAFLSGYATTLPGLNLCDFVSCVDHLSKMRFLYAACLYDHLLVVKFRGDRQAARSRARSLFMLLDHVKSVTKSHSELLMNMAQGPKQMMDSLPLLLKQVFFDTLENETGSL